MCLVTKMIAPRRATRDIVCYKVLVYNTYSNAYGTPYMGTPVSLGIKLEAKKESSLLPDTFGKIYGGFFHMYTTKSDASSIVNYWSQYSTKFRTHVFRRCIIPKGSLYYISTDKSEICATSIIIGNEGDYDNN